jgi:Na+-driven multidrug efflux pump
MKGAAAATVIGQVVSSVMVFLYIRKFKTVKLTAKHFVPQLKTISRICAIGMASCFNQLAIALVQVVLNNSLKHYGGLSIYGDTEPLAVAGIVMKVNMIVFSIVIGLSQGAQPIQSFNYGAKNYKRVKSSYILAIAIGGGISVVAFILFQLIPKQILELFGTGTDTYFEFGCKFFRTFLFFTWLNCIQPISSTFFTSIGKPVKGVFLSLTRQIIFFIPVLLILPKFMGIDGILYTGPICDFLSGIVAAAMTIYEFRVMTKMSAQKQEV